MSSKRSMRIGFALLIAVDLAAAAGYVFFALRNGHGRFDASTLAFAVFPLTGVVIINRQPRNPFGWMIALLGYFNVIANFLGEYAFYTLVTRPGSLPGGDLTSWVSSVWWLAAQPISVAAILLFPDGRPPSRRWWALVWTEFVVSVPVFLYFAVTFWAFRGPRLLTSDMTAVVGPQLAPKVALAVAIWEPVFAGGLVLAVMGQALRFARSRGIERLQMKWILLAMAFVPLSITANMIGVPRETPPQAAPLVAAAESAFNVLSIMGLPVAMTFAITRYHLYDIDLIIRRTLLYGALSITLAVLYFTSVIVLQTLISGMNRGESPVSVVLSTLLIAALFSPLRARFQRIIDRRFYRSRYDSEQIVEHFSASLRAEVDLDALNRHLLQTVEESLQPDRCALWLVKR